MNNRNKMFFSYILVIAFMLFSGSLILSQVEIPRKVNKIIVHNGMSAADNFIYTKRLLAAQDVEIDSQDQDIYQVKTGIIPGKAKSESYYIMLCRDSSIVIRGLMKSNTTINLFGQTSDVSTETIANVGMKGSPYNKIFMAMVDFATMFKGDSISYEVLKK